VHRPVDEADVESLLAQQLEHHLGDASLAVDRRRDLADDEDLGAQRTGNERGGQRTAVTLAVVASVQAGAAGS
jgi:hypothetical protein